jgi:aminopeptidase-like protein
MDASSMAERMDAKAAGAWMYELAAELFPICRSITGDGVRDTLDILSRHVPIDVTEIPTGTPILDWTVPKEWNIRDAYIRDASGRRVVDFRASNLHVMSYSVPVNRTMPLAELKPYCHTLPDQPDRIPYRTSYYKEQWGFCLAHRVLKSLPDGDYDVCIDSTLEDGVLRYGECVIPGATDEEFLISAHVCHPSLANDNLSGIAVAVRLAQLLREAPRRYTYRFLFAPTTFGSIAWLAQNDDCTPRIRFGVSLACLGDAHPPAYKRSRRGDAEIDQAFEYVLERSGRSFELRPFTPYGYDERQYGSPGYNLPFGCFMRGIHGEFPEYHTDADNLDFIRPEHLADSLCCLADVVDTVEMNGRFLNLKPKGEPQLGRRGLYTAYGAPAERRAFEIALLWVLNFSDGEHSLLEIARQSGYPLVVVRRAADALVEAGLLAPC